MNCYVCLVETSCSSHAAVAVCQHCGAAMCEVHLRELSAPPVVGLAGTPRSVLLCCRCAPVAPAARLMPEHQETQQGEYGRSGWKWWGKAQAERRHAESSRGGSSGGTLSQPSAPWVVCSVKLERAEAPLGTFLSW
jgi:hypothetical protein